MTVTTGYPADIPGHGPQEPIGQILKRMGLVTEAQVQQALEIQRKQGGVIGEIMVTLGVVTREEVLLALSIQMGAENVGSNETDPQFLQNSFDAIRDRNARVVEVTIERLDGEPGALILPDDLAQSAPVSKLVNIILATALGARATEVRFESRDETFSVRYRVEGILYDMESPPFHLSAPVIGRLMSESGMDISERVRAQDRRVRITCAGRKYLGKADYRPGNQAESIVFQFSEESAAGG